MAPYTLPRFSPMTRLFRLISRSGCMYCMYGVHLEHEPNRFQLMQVTHPRQYDYCINKLGCGAVLDYIGVPYRNQQLEVDHC